MKHDQSTIKILLTPILDRFVITEYESLLLIVNTNNKEYIKKITLHPTKLSYESFKLLLPYYCEYNISQLLNHMNLLTQNDCNDVYELMHRIYEPKVIVILFKFLLQQQFIFKDLNYLVNKYINYMDQTMLVMVLSNIIKI